MPAQLEQDPSRIAVAKQPSSNPSNYATQTGGGSLPPNQTQPSQAVSQPISNNTSAFVGAKATNSSPLSSPTPLYTANNPPLGYVSANPISSQPQAPKAQFVAPTLENIMTNPIGVAGTVAELAGIAANKLPSNPASTFVNLEVGAFGNMANQGTQVKNAMGAIINAKPSPLPYTPQNPTQKTGVEANVIGEALTVAIAAPVLAPALGIGAGSVLLGEGLSVGINQGLKAYSGRGLLTPEEIVVSAAEGGVFSIVGGKAIEVAGLAGKGLLPAIGRIGLNTGLGAGAGTAQEAYQTGKITGQGTIQGAEYGFAFGLAGEAGRYAGGKLNAKYDISGKLQRNIPIPKYGDVNVPLDNGESVNYKGIYLSRGSEAKSLIGRMSEVPEGENIQQGYMPKSNIESLITQEVMGKAGYQPESLQAVSDVREVMRTTQNTRPQTLNEVFPKQTNTLSIEGANTVKEFITQNIDKVDMVYGSYATKPQLSESFEYTKGGISALRSPGDIDVQLNTDQIGAESFTKDLVTKLQGVGETVKVSSERPTLIEANIGGGKYAHAVDIHYQGEASDINTPSNVGEQRWGFKINKSPVEIEKLPAMALNEQGLRKGSAIMGFKEDQGIGPEVWRGKDVPDFFQAQRTLLEQMPIGKTSSAMEAFNRASDYYGVNNALSSKSQPDSFVFSPSAKGSPNVASSLGLIGVSSSRQASPNNIVGLKGSPSMQISKSATSQSPSLSSIGVTSPSSLRSFGFSPKNQIPSSMSMGLPSGKLTSLGIPSSSSPMRTPKGVPTPYTPYYPIPSKGTSGGSPPPYYPSGIPKSTPYPYSLPPSRNGSNPSFPSFGGMKYENTPFDTKRAISYPGDGSLKKSTTSEN